MPLASLGFLVGVLICQSLTELPMREWSFLIIILLPLLLRFPEFRFVIVLLLGFLYSVLIAHSKLATQISPPLDGEDFLVSGTVLAITSHSADRPRSWPTVSGLSEFPSNETPESTATLNGKTPPRLVQQSWYQDAPDISGGQRRQLKVRLKSPRGFSNPGAFD